MRPLRHLRHLPHPSNHLRRQLTTLPLTATFPPNCNACTCQPTPATSSPIDHETPLRHSAPAYTHHLLIPSKVPPQKWGSKIESTFADTPGPAIPGIGAHVAGLKAAFRGRPNEVGLITAVCPPVNQNEVWALPAGRRFSGIETAQKWAEGKEEVETGALQKGNRIPDSVDAVVLVCVHGTRDARCGEMGPPLIQQFEDVLAAKEVPKEKVVVAGCSHLSGHKWAGNVVVYRRHEQGTETENDFWGVWYGRITPKEVEAIVMETVENGRVLDAGLLRGVVAAEVEVGGWTGGKGPAKRGSSREILRAEI
ncbi:hypothetical protein EX30DRAFT_337167 [Ascodesmis nigricans]|uniref:Sucraseferredoxin-like protein n=1 Tax=Ascodesmis nigricans TaxID=341454 RepID=A0A4S2N5T9_9PEZI|nr:hypothetical protein EX30DRAFT_337167 [Ascodesmis nigricans]